MVDSQVWAHAVGTVGSELGHTQKHFQNPSHAVDANRSRDDPARHPQQSP
jgi:hypothetical protein